MESYDVVIVGSGHGGAQTAIALRQAKFGGSILMVGDDPELPYEKPPLSKDYLTGEKPFGRLLIRPAEFWSERGVELRLGERVASVDARAQQITIEAGVSVRYGELVWATGGRARRLTCAGHDLAGVHTLRTRADADELKRQLSDVSQAVVIGGGYIGLEAASALTKLGKKVVLFEALDRVLARVAGEALSRFFETEHRAHGVDVRLGAAVDCILGQDGVVTGVRLVSGETVAAQMVVAGIGIVPAVDAILKAGAAGGNGVAVDEQCRTSLPHVFAIGDCALHANPFCELAVRLESVQNASDQATVVAQAITGQSARYDSVPWFWSNQYDLKLQTVGLSAGHDAAVVRGDIESRSFSVVYLRAQRVIALDCVNAVKDYVQGRKLVQSGAKPAVSRLVDTTIALKDL